MGWSFFVLMTFSLFGLVIINDFNIKGITLIPCKTDTPLPVNVEAVQITSASFKCFQPIARGQTQILNLPGGINHSKFSQCTLLNRFRQFF
jgi:hypothetical protein